MAFVTLQLIVVIFALFAWSRAIFRYKDHKINLSALALWSLIWFGVIISVLLPQTSRAFADLLGINRPVDALVYGSIVALLYLVFRLYVQMESSNFEMTRLVRALAIRNARRPERRK